MEDRSDGLDGSSFRPGSTYLTRPTRLGSICSIKQGEAGQKCEQNHCNKFKMPWGEMQWAQPHPRLKLSFLILNFCSNHKSPFYSVKSDPSDPSNPFVHCAPDPGTNILPERVKFSSLVADPCTVRVGGRIMICFRDFPPINLSL